jgi:DNA-binding XRE family transcriptional regulator
VGAGFALNHGGPEYDSEGTDMSAKSKKSKNSRPAELLHLGARIREERHRQGVTQAALAEELDLSVAYVSLIERGGRNPPYTTVVAIARALEVPAARIVAND